MPKAKNSWVYMDEYDAENFAFYWQMLAALIFDNKIEGMPDVIMKNASMATEYLIHVHARDFNSPENRRKVLRRFLKKIDKYRDI